VYGKIGGLKASHLKRLQNIYTRRISKGEIISRETVRRLAEISADIKRQVALLVGRRGDVEYVVVGNDHSILIPDLTRFRSGAGRLKGLRCVHTHLHGEPLSHEDLTDLALLNLDLMLCISVTPYGIPAELYIAHLLPKNKSGQPWIVERVDDIGRLHFNFSEFIRDLESELSKTVQGAGMEKKEKAVLVSVTKASKMQAQESLQELEQLAATSDLSVAGSFIQRKAGADSRSLLGKGKLSELVVYALQKGADLLIFDGELTPAQVRVLTDYTEMRIIDRTQLILDIFARRAITREGKIQVELAQLRYLLPRLITKNTAMSRLTGGIGGRGPGETKLEINRRRVRDRITLLNSELEKVKGQRKDRRKKRRIRRCPVISIVGYTNAGKSTLLNTLTKSQVRVEDRLFVTLDPTSRRLRLNGREVILTDTVGFIRDLPGDLLEAFAATLEELHEADLLLHVTDISDPLAESRIASVNKTLNRLDLSKIPTILVLNKMDRLDGAQTAHRAKSIGGIPISALNRGTLSELRREVEAMIF
jgi:GTP-binding protein HflX